MTILNLDKQTFHHTHRPCKPIALEIPKKTEQVNSPVAQRTSRLQLQTLACPQKITHGSQHPLTTSRGKWRQKRQPTNDHDSRSGVHKTSRPWLRWLNQTHHHDNPKSQSHLDERMGKNVSHQAHRQPQQTVLERYQRTLPRCSPRPGPKTWTDEHMAQRFHQWTPRTGWNNQMHQSRILLARHKRMDHRIHQRMHNLSTKQESDTPHQTPNISHSINNQCQTILSHSNGPHHRPPQKQRKWCHTNYSQSWMLTSSNLLPCSTTITGADITQLYLEHIFRWFGLRQKIISDRNPHFTSHFTRELTKGLGID